MRIGLYFFLFCLIFPIGQIKAQAEFLALLECMLSSSHWEGFYCKGADDEILLTDIITQNKIPIYQDLTFKGRKIQMKTAAHSPQRYALQIRKVKYSDDFAHLKVLYDKRVKASFKLMKNDHEQWYVARSTFKQHYACGGRAKRKSFIWNF